MMAGDFERAEKIIRKNGDDPDEYGFLVSLIYSAFGEVREEERESCTRIVTRDFPGEATEAMIEAAETCNPVWIKAATKNCPAPVITVDWAAAWRAMVGAMRCELEG